MGKIRKGLEKALNWGKAAIVSLPLVATNYSCEKEDTTPPKIRFISPKEGEVYYDKIIPICWEIEDQGDFKEAWISFNEKGKFPIPKSGSLNWQGINGYNKIVIESSDLNLNYSKDSVKVYYWSGLVKRANSDNNKE